MKFKFQYNLKSSLGKRSNKLIIGIHPVVKINQVLLGTLAIQFWNSTIRIEVWAILFVLVDIII